MAGKDIIFRALLKLVAQFAGAVLQALVSQHILELLVQNRAKHKVHARQDAREVLPRCLDTGLTICPGLGKSFNQVWMSTAHRLFFVTGRR